MLFSDATKANLGSVPLLRAYSGDTLADNWQAFTPSIAGIGYQPATGSITAYSIPAPPGAKPGQWVYLTHASIIGVQPGAVIPGWEELLIMNDANGRMQVLRHKWTASDTAINVSGLTLGTYRACAMWLDYANDAKPLQSGAWPRTNRALNPGFENGVNSFAPVSTDTYPMTVDTSNPIAGSRSALFTRAGALTNTIAAIMGTISNGAFAITDYQTVNCAMTIKTDVPNASIATRFYWYDSNMNLTQSSEKAQFSNCVAGQKYRVAHSASSPAGKVWAYFVVIVRTPSGNAVVGQRVWADELTIEFDNTDGSYFDGSTPNADGWYYAWAGAANASQSTATALGDPGISNVVFSMPPAPASGCLVFAAASFILPSTQTIDSVPIVNGSVVPSLPGTTPVSKFVSNIVMADCSKATTATFNSVISSALRKTFVIKGT